MLSQVQLSQSNLIHNFQLFRSLLPKQTKVAACIKANAYGHGQNEVAQILEPYADLFQVDNLQELTKLRQVSQKPTLVLGYTSPKDLKETISQGCSFVIYNTDALSKIEKAGQELGKIPHIHLMIDAYLGRDGILVENLADFLRKLRQRKIILDGIYAHFSNLEDTDDHSHAVKQIENYQRALQTCKALGITNLQTHISATAAILIYNHNFDFTTARLGIGLYGLWPSESIRQKFEQENFQLKPTLRWVTQVAQVKDLPANFPIGYGITYITDKPTKVALIPQGYSDGYDRKLSNRGEVLIGGARCKVLGRIAMNMFVANISHLPDVNVGDEIVLLGVQGNEEVTAEELAEKVGTINYEIVTRINPLIPRVMK